LKWGYSPASASWRCTRLFIKRRFKIALFTTHATSKIDTIINRRQRPKKKNILGLHINIAFYYVANQPGKRYHERQ
jgi:hypothetical protein